MGGRVSTALSVAYPTEIAISGGHLYAVSETGYDVESAVILGGAPLTELATNQLQVDGIAADASYVCWANAGDGTVKKIPLGAGAITTLATGQGQPGAIAVDATSAYFVDGLNGRIVKITPK